MPRRTVAQVLVAKNKVVSLVGASGSSVPPPNKKQKVAHITEDPLLPGIDKNLEAQNNPSPPITTPPPPAINVEADHTSQHN